jgi:hypothetical protein
MVNDVLLKVIEEKKLMWYGKIVDKLEYWYLKIFDDNCI